MQYTQKELVTAMRSVLLCTGLMGLAACGGGGGGNVRETPPLYGPQPPTAPTTPPPTTPTAPVVSTPNPAYSQHIALTNTAPAHQAGFTGAGLRIGVLDSGVMRNHPALAPRVVANFNYVSSPPNNLQVDDVLGHGTEVAQLAAGTPFGAWPGGIAPGAQIVSARILADKPPSDDGSGQGNEVDGELGLREIHQQLISSGVRIMNNSWGGLYWTNTVATNPIADEYRPFVLGNNGLVVFATGNDARANPDSMAGLPSQPGPNGTLPAADLERGWLAVTAVNPNNVQQLDVGPDGAVYANACGIAVRYCLAAPGTTVFTGATDGPTAPTYWKGSGTSFAAPQVSGAAALVWQAFPYFTNDLVRQTLLGTATDLGTPGPDGIFGYGLLNVGRAINGPGRFDWGEVSVDVGGTSRPWSNPIAGSGGLRKRGAGTLALTGANTYTGRTTVEAGILEVQRAMPGGATVQGSGRLRLRAGLQGNPVSANVGSLDNSGTIEFLGGDTAQGATYAMSSLRNNASGAMELQIGAHLDVSGTATLGGELRLTGRAPNYIIATPSINTPTRETFLNAASVSGTFATVTWSPFVAGSVAYAATDVSLLLSRADVATTASSLGLTATSLSSAQRMEGAMDQIDASIANGEGASNDVLAGAIAFQGTPDAAAAERSLASLSGELHVADASFAMMAIEGNRRALESRIDALQEAPLGGAWFDDLDSQRALARFDMQAEGWMAGQDRRLGALTVGAALAQTEGWAHHEQRFDREHNRQLEAQFYASYDLGQGYLLGSLAVGRMQRWTRRDVLLGVDAFRLGTDYAQRYASVGMQAGLPMHVGEGRITPYVGVQNLQLERDGFSENGASGFGLSADGSSMRVSQALLGARYATQWSIGSAQWDLQARMEWQRLLSQSGGDVQARFTALDVWSPIVGGALDRDVGVLGFGVGTWLRNGSRLSLDLDARNDHGQTWTQAMLNWSAGF
ncbi:autotransporter serine protease [Lysobacter auxotrophicus]|uniref:Autotransporter serine protease n=1 Tax=Lysobacter auxotrophicus TaxID=2992573 RepID=A0ABM8DEW0_9GAMM|nr:autotransporter serine protease [Lysobacter auxotrophicus]BDU17102.1 autotransporter serine protease [Lysobacter auxotrophicus]